MKLLTAAVLSLAALSSCSIVKSSDNFELLILHNNDMHARFEQTSQLSGACTTADREAGKCYGGFPRVAHVVKEARRAAQTGEGPPVLYLNAGDTYTGTAWFTIYKWKIAAEFINALQPDAVSLGNHEFDESVDGVIPFIRNLNAPVLAANLILDKVPTLQSEKNLLKSIVLQKNNVKIGIIGYLTPETQILSPKMDVEYEDEIIALKREVKKLKQQNVNILIALGHSGFLKDLEIAREVEDLDVVIGGHSNTFLLNNSTLEIPEVPQGAYPTEVQQADGRIVRVVQAYAYTKYMGHLHLIFDSSGEVIKCDGSPLILDQKIPKDPELLKLVDKYRADVDRINNEVVGSSAVFLNGEDCRLRECNLGDIITDSILYYTKAKYENEYSDATLSFVQGGRIRASIKHPGIPFDVTRGDWITVLPFSDSLTVVTMNGTILRQSLEHSISTWRIVDSTGQFLQFSGMKVSYDLAQPVGSRVIKAKAICSNCEGQMRNIRDDLIYKTIMPVFIADGGDGYSIFEKLPKETLVYNELDCIVYYLSNHSPINPKLDGRIQIFNEDKEENGIRAAARSYSSSEVTAPGPELFYMLVLTIMLL